MYRSYLFVPGDRPERFDKAVASGADVVILDLEDAVLPEGKAGARKAVAEWLDGGGRAALRINAAGTPWHQDDLALAGHANVMVVMVPKAEDAATLAQIGAALPAGRALVPLIETAEGLLEARAIAKVANVLQLAFGSVDYQNDVGIGDDATAFDFARCQIAVASAAARIAPPVDGVTLSLDDPQQLATEVRNARRLGFGGKLCIHPRQVAGVHEGLAPDAAEQEHARAIVAAAEAAGVGAVQLDGRMIDRPVVERARRLIAAVTEG
ncbi:CoA ester lyase [Acuticoccus sp. I52.16.1]|uniref:HpcH/HpaI aldolase/citrate lyase family protein n=1 Tax=Acuticoccus sp. I52.16.1 TaxID=2928472 RepID=UPI001FD0BB51|nr:CoA ester lyase [Acuticoccus sp. I52.16.1]UOM33843.1 CoA ester lyase [Acuticoccus sp. I52.16.1]